jgi:hypothetical protein
MRAKGPLSAGMPMMAAAADVCPENVLFAASVWGVKSVSSSFMYSLWCLFKEVAGDVCGFREIKSHAVNVRDWVNGEIIEWLLSFGDL